MTLYVAVPPSNPRLHIQPGFQHWGRYECPPCFDDLASWRRWQRLAEEVGWAPGLPCQDCTVAYQAEMIQVERCHNPHYPVSED